MDARVASLAPFADFFVLDIAQIGLWQAVVEGDQSEIDAGRVTAIDWSSHGFPKSCLPGEGCTVWLGGHRYVVESAAITGIRAPKSVIHGDLVVQTSLSNARRLLVYASFSDHWFEAASCTMTESSEPTCAQPIALPRPARF